MTKAGASIVSGPVLQTYPQARLDTLSVSLRMSWVSYPFTLAQLLDSLVRVTRRGIRDRIPSHLGLYVFTVANAWPIHIKAFVRLGPEGPYNPRPPHGTNRTPTTRPTRPSPCSWPRPLRRAPRTYVQGPLRCHIPSRARLVINVTSEENRKYKM